MNRFRNLQIVFGKNDVFAYDSDYPACEIKLAIANLTIFGKFLHVFVSYMLGHFQMLSDA